MPLGAENASIIYGNRQSVDLEEPTYHPRSSDGTGHSKITIIKRNSFGHLAFTANPYQSAVCLKSQVAEQGQAASLQKIRHSTTLNTRSVLILYESELQNWNKSVNQPETTYWQVTSIGIRENEVKQRLKTLKTDIECTRQAKQDVSRTAMIPPMVEVRTCGIENGRDKYLDSRLDSEMKSDLKYNTLKGGVKTT
ncbi:hypothetical protein K438DRAFT_1780767 [Mycena galopus ATCC 62051]|nr:hypothetical protein K438DRAFT_1780767 [Mycena galopus ATCC 62051]